VTPSLVTVGELASVQRNALVGGPFGSDLTSRDYVAEGVPVIRGANLAHGRWVGGDFVYVTEEKADTLSANCARPGDLVFTQRGTLGQVAIVPRSGVGRYLISQSQMKLTVDLERVDPLYVYYTFCTPQVREYIRAHTIQTGVPHINLGILRNIPVPLPSLNEQRQIVGILGLLDEKIEVETRIAGLIPQIIRATVDAANHELSEAVPVSALAHFTNGGAYTKGASGSGRLVIRIAELNGEPGPSTVYNEIDVPEEKIARPGDLLMAWSGSLGIHRWSREEAIVNQHIFKVTPKEFPAWLVFDRVDYAMPRFRRIAQDKATTMGHIQRGHLDSTEISVPAPGLVSRMRHDIDPLWERLLVADRQAHSLARLRDALLPELMSGRLSIPDAATVA